MKIKKLLSLVLVGAMAASLLAGCGAAAGGEEEAAPAAGGEEAAVDGSASAEAASSFEGFEELVELKGYGLSFFGDNGVAEVNEAVNAITVDAINVSLDYTPMDVPTYMEQIGLMLSGGEKFDLCLCTAIPVISFSTLTSQNELLDISPYLEEYAPEMTEMMAPYIGGTTVGDAIYAVPCMRSMKTNQYLLMRKDVLDELGLTEKAQNMKTWTEFEEIMAAVYDAQATLPDDLKTNSVIVNCDQGGAVITSAGYDTAAEEFAGCYNFDNLGDLNKMIYVDEETDTVMNWLATDDYKTCIERVRGWYEKGYVYKDAATTDESGDTMVMNKVGFCEITCSEYGVEMVKQQEMNCEIVAVQISEGVVKSANANTWAWAVPVTSENPEAAVAFLNLMYTNADICNLYCFGIEGRDYEVVDGQAVIIPGGYMANDFCFGNQFLAYPKEGLGADFREKSLEDMEAAKVSKYMGCVINTEPVANEITAIKGIIDKYQPGLESGSADPATLDQFLAEVESAGMQTVLDYYQGELDAFLGK